MAEQHAHAAEHDDHDHKPHGWRRWVYATNHKDIGTMYLVFAGIMFFIGGAMAMVIRAELFKPGSSPRTARGDYPSKDELLTALEDAFSRARGAACTA